MPSRSPDYLLRNVCVHCGKETYGKHRRKYCSSECIEEAQGGVDPITGRMSRDPTPEQIAEMCKKLREGELHVSSASGSKFNRQPPNWFVSKKIR